MRSIHSFPARRNPRGGASLVEFALIFIVFLLFVVGVVEFGRGVWTFTTISHATRQGARFAMIRGGTNPASADQVRNVVRNAAIGLNQSQIQVATTWPSGVQKGNVVQVRTSYPFQLVAGGLLLPQTTIQISASSEMILAN
jgi:Flp pilus assembly protein TadG